MSRSHFNTKAIGFALFAGLAVTAGWYLTQKDAPSTRLSPSSLRENPERSSTVGSDTSQMFQKEQILPLPPISAPLTKSKARPNPDRIRDYLGRRYSLRHEDYQLTFAPDGRMGSFRRHERPDSQQPPLSKDEAISKARELIEAFDLSGEIADGSRLNIAELSPKTNGDHAVRVEQTLNDLPMEPRSEIQIIFGSDGVPRGVFSTLTEALTGFQTSEKLSEAEARIAAKKSIETLGSQPGLPTQGGRKIYWIHDGGGKTPRPIAEARVAYEYWIDGYYVVIDAATGETLYRRRQRQS